MNHLNKDIVFGICKSKLGVFSVVIAIMGGLFFWLDNLWQLIKLEMQPSPNTRARRTTSDPASSSSRYQPYGASMPYTRYEADKGNLLEKAEVEQSQDSHQQLLKLLIRLMSL